MKAPRNQCRRARPTLPTRTMDLLGLGKDGNLYLWSEAAQVQPLDRFPMSGGYIVSGHYVIEWHGKVITVYLTATTYPDALSVQFMCLGEPACHLGKAFLEGALLGRYVPDPVKQAEMVDTLQRMKAEAIARQTAPHRRRGEA